MTKILTIAEIFSLDRPTYVLIAGGIAVGKSYVIRHHNSNFEILDIDEYLEMIGGTHQSKDDYERASNLISLDFERLMSEKKSIVAMGTARDLNFSIKRLLNAKKKGYRTVLLHIKTDVDTAIFQNNERREKGSRAVPIKDEALIEQTINGSANSVSFLKNSDLIDFFCSYVNQRVTN